MSTSRSIIDVVYGVFADNNISRILPVLDEKIVFRISAYGPADGEYHGRSGFLTMMSSIYKRCENLSVNSLVYFMPDSDQPQDVLITTGVFAGKLLIDNEPAVFPFLHYWQVKNDKVVELRAFNWDSASLFDRLQQNNKEPDHLANRHHSGNGNSPQS